MVDCEMVQMPNQHNLPDLLWLLRDVDQLLVDENGKPTSATKYVHRQLQKAGTSQAGSTMLHHFPSLHCLTLPPPSSDRKILSNIITNSDKLTTSFNSNLQYAIRYILDNIKRKQGYNSTKNFDGNLLACLIRQFHKILSSSHNVPNLHMSWSMVVKTTLKKKAFALLSHYESDMRRLLDGKLPIADGLCGETGETLMNIHLQVFAKKRLELKNEILCYQSCSSSDNPSPLETEVISLFDDSIIVYDTVLHSRVVGGRLLDFINENMSASEEYCTALYRNKYEKIVGSKIRRILSKEIPELITEELKRFSNEYFSEAKGPAISKVFKSLSTAASKREAEVEMVPGPVTDLEAVGVDADRVKLRWKKPDINPSAAAYYEVMTKSRGRSWKVVKVSHGLSALVTGLKCSTWYGLTVKARNDRYCGNKILLIRVRTLMSQSLQKVVGAGTIVASPIVYPCMVAYTGYGYVTRGMSSNSASDVAGGALMLAMLPVTVVVGLTPIAGSLACNDSYKNEISKRKGDLEEPECCAESLVCDGDITSRGHDWVDDDWVDIPCEGDDVSEHLSFAQDLDDSADES